jgi:hypothetical protein
MNEFYLPFYQMKFRLTRRESSLDSFIINTSVTVDFSLIARR